MSEVLDNFEMKIVYFVRALTIGVSVCLLLVSSWLILFKNFYQQSVMFFPAILSIGILFNVYRLNRILKINKGTVNKLQVKCWLLEFGSVAHVSVAYLAFVVDRPWYGIIFSALAIANLVCEAVISCQKVNNIDIKN